MNARRLLHWGDLEDRRRLGARAGVAAWSSWVWAVLGGLLLCADVARRVGAFGAAVAGDAGLPAASRLLLLVIAAGNVLVVFGTPFRLYWRHDAPLLGRLSIPGRSLFVVGVVRSLRATGRVLVVCVPGVLGLLAVPDIGMMLVVRHLALAIAAAFMSGLLAPAAGLLAGAMVASDKVHAALDSFGGELRGPRTSWLGFLPGVTAAAVALLVLATSLWVRGRRTCCSARRWRSRWSRCCGRCARPTRSWRARCARWSRSTASGWRTWTSWGRRASSGWSPGGWPGPAGPGRCSTRTRACCGGASRCPSFSGRSV
jgi:hypothetical protein